MTDQTRVVDRFRRLVHSSVLTRFASMGVINTLVDLGLYVLLYTLGVMPVVANFVSTSAGLAVSFVGNRRFVFRSEGNRVREAVSFLLVAGTGIWVIQPIVILAATAGLTELGVTTTALVGTISKVLAIGVAAVWNYLLYSRLVFRNRHTPRTPGPAA